MSEINEFKHYNDIIAEGNIGVLWGKLGDIEELFVSVQDLINLINNMQENMKDKENSLKYIKKLLEGITRDMILRKNPEVNGSDKWLN